MSTQPFYKKSKFYEEVEFDKYIKAPMSIADEFGDALFRVTSTGNVEYRGAISKIGGSANNILLEDGSVLDKNTLATTAQIPTVNNGEIKYTGVGAITGGGASTANQAGNTDYTFDLTSTTKSDIAKGVTAHGWGNHASQGYLKRDTLNEVTEDFKIVSDELWIGEERNAIIKNTAEIAGEFSNVEAGLEYNQHGDNPIIGLYNEADLAEFGNPEIKVKGSVSVGAGDFQLIGNFTNGAYGKSSSIAGSSYGLTLYSSSDDPSNPYDNRIDLIDSGIWINNLAPGYGYKLPDDRGNVGQVLTMDSNGETIWYSDKYVQVLNKTHSISSTGAFEIDLLNECPDVDISEYLEWDIVWTDEVGGKKVLYNLKGLGWVEEPLLGQYDIGNPMCITLSGSSKMSFTIPSNAKLVLRK